MSTWSGEGSSTPVDVVWGLIDQVNLLKTIFKLESTCTNIAILILIVITISGIVSAISLFHALLGSGLFFHNISFSVLAIVGRLLHRRNTRKIKD